MGAHILREQFDSNLKQYAYVEKRRYREAFYERFEALHLCEEWFFRTCDLAFLLRAYSSTISFHYMV